MSALASLALSLLLCTVFLPAVGGAAPMPLSAAHQRLLFQIAREGITAHLQGRPAKLPPELPPELKEPRGVFVTLTCRGRLRGCIGYLEAVKPLAQAVQDMAVAAAFQDPRFPPLRAEELADLELEISLLTPMRPVTNVEEIEVGKHGLYVERGAARGLLLPQVATEYRWDRTTFLEQTCNKAGLPPHAWQDPQTKIFVFAAEILHEPHAATSAQEPRTQ